VGVVRGGAWWLRRGSSEMYGFDERSESDKRLDDIKKEISDLTQSVGCFMMMFLIVVLIILGFYMLGVGPGTWRPNSRADQTEKAIEGKK
jgi:hypothetical protein